MNASLNPIVFALRHPITVMAGVAALVVGSVLALGRMPIDLFPTLDLPVLCIAQPYGGLNPAQMETQVTRGYDYALYINGVHHVESRTIQGTAVVKVFFHPGTNMAQAMAETIGYVNRTRVVMPPGTPPPYVLRFDVSNVPIGYLVVESTGDRSMGELSELMSQRVQPIFAGVPGATSPPPLGGNSRAIVLTVDPERLRAYRLSPDDLVSALSSGNVVLPSGSARVRDQMPLVSSNAQVIDPQELGDIPIRPREDLYLRDLCTIANSVDTATGYALVGGKRTVYLLVTKTAEASTLAVVNAVKSNLPRMQEALPPDVRVRFDFDQSPHVTQALWGVAAEGAVGAVLTGLMVLLFLRDWRSVIVVVLNIPLALMGALLGLWATGQTLNLMTLGGLALAVGILVDEATVEVENIHSQMERTGSVAVAVRRGNSETAVPRLLAMLCVLAVFLPVFFMEGAARSLFVPLALAVSFAMITSYLLSSMFVPVVSVWLLRHHSGAPLLSTQYSVSRRPSLTDRYAWLLERVVRRRWALIGVYLVGCAAVLLGAGSQVGTQIFPSVDTGQFLLRLRAPTGTRIERTEEIARKALELIGEAVGPGNVATTVGYVGVTPPNYAAQALYLWSSGPEEAVLRVALKHDSGVRVDTLRARLRQELPARLGAWLAVRLREEGMTEEEIARRTVLRLSFGPADVINEVMSFGSPTPIEVVVHGPNQRDNLLHAARVKAELEKVSALRDLQYRQSQDYPTVEVQVDRAKAGQSGATVQEVGRALLSATSSSRLVVPIFWADTDNGVNYPIQLQVAPPRIDSAEEVGMVPVKQTPHGQLLIRDVAQVRDGTMPGEYDRYNLRRVVSLTANMDGNDLGRVERDVRQAIDRSGTPPRGVRVDLRGQIEPMGLIFNGLASGLALAVVAIFLVLTAYFQSPKLALVAVAAVPAVLAGVALALAVTGTTLNIQSFMGAIMAIGVAVANAILLVTFAERHRRQDRAGATPAAVQGAKHRLRPILMTSGAMLAGMVPMALALGEGGEQTAPLARAVLGGLIAATLATLLVLPAVFAAVQEHGSTTSPSLDPADPESVHHHPEAARLG